MILHYMLLKNQIYLIIFLSLSLTLSFSTQHLASLNIKLNEKKWLHRFWLSITRPVINIMTEKLLGVNVIYLELLYGPLVTYISNNENFLSHFLKL